MSGDRKLQRNDSETDRVEEVMRSLKIEGSDDNGGVSNEANAYPDRPNEPDCIYYLRTGSCGYGSNCRFNHPSKGGQIYDVKNTSDLPERAGQPDCGYFLKTGTCKYGLLCKYHHPKDKRPDIVMNSLGLPMRKDAEPCAYYMRTGSCKYGPACKFDHPPPASTGNVNVLPVVEPVYGFGGSPSSGATSSAAALPNATSSLQLPQSYMPFYLSPSNGWHAHMGSVNPFSVTSVLGYPATYGQLSVPDPSHCRYFVTHGSCKYGSECKYYHPLEKTCSVGPLGLPLRPGQAVCSYYSLYGVCNYGPACRFDHPLNGYSYAYSLNIPSFGTVCPPPVTPYQRTLVPLSESKSDWITKGSTANDHKNQNANKKSDGDSRALSYSTKDTSEILPDGSD